jgi:outer membrane receptor protein involved in Fe transport
MNASGQIAADGLPGPDVHLGSYSQFDFTIGYSAERTGLLQWWRVQLALTNLFDEEPDFFVIGGNPAGAAWEYKYGLPLGRTYSVQLTTTF